MLEKITKNGKGIISSSVLEISLQYSFSDWCEFSLLKKTSIRGYKNE